MNCDRLCRIVCLTAAAHFAGAGAPVGAQQAAQNVEPPRVTFTVATAVLVGDLYGTPNVKLDEYVYFVDPLGRGLTMAGVAVYPKRRDPARGAPSAAERFAILAGGAVTPAGGFGVGASWMLARGVAINGGMAVLLVNGAKDGKGIGEVPEDFASPFRTATARAWFVGANYTFDR